MLVLIRRKNEAIVIEGQAVISIIEIRGDKVRLGIDAPRETMVHRQEIYKQIHGKKTPWDTPKPPPPPPEPAA